MTTLPRPSDVDMFGLAFDEDPHHGRFELTDHLARPDGSLYGGTAIAASVVAMEAATGRPALWITTQFVASARVGEVVEVTTEVLARGRRIAQVQVSGRVGGRVVFVSLGSTAHPRDGGLEGQYQAMPRVAPPEESGSMPFGPPRTLGAPGFTMRVEYRWTELLGDQGPTAPTVVWARLTDGRPLTPAGVAFLADMVPAAVIRAAGAAAGGTGPGGATSLDNSMRFGTVAPEEEWILLEMWGHMATGGSGHGSVLVWTPGGALIAAGGQTANVLHAPDSAAPGALTPGGAG
jgi:acyl-CoA thioesterase